MLYGILIAFRPAHIYSAKPLIISKDGVITTFRNVGQYTDRHSVTSHKTWTFVDTDVRTSNISEKCILIRNNS